MRRAVRAAAALVLAASLALGAASAVQLRRATAERAAIAALAAGQDIAVADSAPAPLLAARARMLLAHGRTDAAQAIADRLRGDPAQHASLLYAMANARLRAALAIFAQVPFRVVKPGIAQARADYRLAVALDPDNWDARYNYAIAAALLRDTESAAPSAGDEMAHERAAWPDIPGAPNGMP